MLLRAWKLFLATPALRGGTVRPAAQAGRCFANVKYVSGLAMCSLESVLKPQKIDSYVEWIFIKSHHRSIFYIDYTEGYGIHQWQYKKINQFNLNFYHCSRI